MIIMAFTLETKLHILLIMIVIGISLYMYLLYKEVKVFQDEIVVIKAQIAQMQIASMRPASQAQPLEEEVKSCGIKIVDADIDEDEDEDEHSVTSNEIKNILTNIHETEEEEDAGDELELTIIKEEAPTPAPQHKELDLSTLSEDELALQKYEVLREFLRGKKKNIKGTKAEMIKRILDLEN